MSQWTHVCGCIRVDALRFCGNDDKGNIEKALGHIVNFGDDSYVHIDGLNRTLTMNKEQHAQRMGQRITALRKLEGISQQELADRAGLTRQHIGRIEKGELVSVAYVTIQQIAEALGMTVDIIDPDLQDLAPLKKLT